MHAVPHPDRLSLDGTWRFQLLGDADADVGRGRPGANEVPGCWTLQGTWDLPHYTNVQMPFPGEPPDVPDANPTGVYERDVRRAGGLARAGGSCSTSVPPRAC